MNSYNQSTIDTFHKAADIFEGWDKDAKSGRYKGKKEEATAKIREELPTATEAWPAIHEAENDPQLGLPIMRSGHQWPGANLDYLKTVYFNHKDDQGNIDKHIDNLSQELTSEGGCGFILDYQSLAVELRRWETTIESIIADNNHDVNVSSHVPHTKHPTQQEKQQETIRPIIIDLDKVFKRNGIWRKEFVRLVKDEKRDGVKIADSSFNRIKLLLTKKGYHKVADKLNHKGDKMFIDIPYGQIAVISE